MSLNVFHLLQPLDPRNDLLQACELFFPLQSPGSPRGGNPRKMGKNYKIPLPGPTPENRENYRKITKNVFSEYFL